MGFGVVGIEVRMEEGFAVGGDIGTEVGFGVVG